MKPHPIYPGFALLVRWDPTMDGVFKHSPKIPSLQSHHNWQASPPKSHHTNGKPLPNQYSHNIRGKEKKIIYSRKRYKLSTKEGRAILQIRDLDRIFFLIYEIDYVPNSCCLISSFIGYMSINYLLLVTWHQLSCWI